MRLLYCAQCGDVFRLVAEPRRCTCGWSGGRSLEPKANGEPAVEVWGEAAVAYLSHMPYPGEVLADGDGDWVLVPDDLDDPLIARVRPPEKAPIVPLRAVPAREEAARL